MKKTILAFAVVMIAAAAIYVGGGLGLHRTSLSSSVDMVSSTPELLPPRESTKEQAGIAATRSGKSQRIPVEMSPQKALVDAHAISRCMRLGDGEISLPEDLTKEQRQQVLESSGVRDLDCSALSSPYSLYELAEYAAESGDVQAQLDFSALAASLFNEEQAALDPKLIAKYKADSLRFLDMAVRSGSAEAMSRLSESYDSGLFTRKDPVRAYAYAYARDQIVHSRISNARLMQLQGRLSVAQQQQGQQIGQIVLTH